MAAREIGTSIENTGTAQPTPGVKRPILKQPIFDWKAPNKSHELKSFEIEFRNIFSTNSYSMQDSEKRPLIMSWLL